MKAMRVLLYSVLITLLLHLPSTLSADEAESRYFSNEQIIFIYCTVICNAWKDAINAGDWQASIPLYSRMAYACTSLFEDDPQWCEL